LLAKVIAHAPTRADALARLVAALEETVLAGPRSNLLFLRCLLAAPAMQAGQLDAGWLERDLADFVAPSGPDYAAAARAVELLVAREQDRLHRRAWRRSSERRSPWDAGDAFGLSGEREMRLDVIVDGGAVVAQLRFEADRPWATIEGTAAADCLLIDAEDGLLALREGRQTSVRLASADAAAASPLVVGGVVVAPMHGKVLAVEVALGDRVRKGQRLAVIEAMKMEHALTAPAAGIIKEIAVSEGSQVAQGTKLLVIADAEKEN
jgi:3-methylcrotonyl-CoA carboxylase alpha subunit